MNDRIHELRKALGLTAEKFGNIIGVGKGAVSATENKRNNVSEGMINSILKTNWNGQYVNENWLRTGSGPMFVEMTRNQIIFAFANDVMKDLPDSFRRAFVEQLAELTPDGWRWLRAFCEGVLARIPDDVPDKKDGDISAPAPADH